MHPSFALWMWSMTMMRIMQNPFAGDAGGPSPTTPQRPSGGRLDAISIRAAQYLRSDVIDTPLPNAILDKLADLHWMERDPELAI